MSCLEGVCMGSLGTPPGLALEMAAEACGPGLRTPGLAPALPPVRWLPHPLRCASVSPSREAGEAVPGQGPQCSWTVDTPFCHLPLPADDGCQEGRAVFFAIRLRAQGSMCSLSSGLLTDGGDARENARPPSLPLSSDPHEREAQPGDSGGSSLWEPMGGGRPQALQCQPCWVPALPF